MANRQRSNIYFYIKCDNLLDKHRELNRWFYEKEIQKELLRIYNNYWQPTDGVVYPLMSKLNVNNLVISKWHIVIKIILKKTRNT